ncbi:MAG: thiamine pyrophosphate-dependent enzyme, partial [Microlunatus sp.]|nr:thiamine pyrophosphate-dependent enzyme [Microlunatus sp.]
GRRVDQQATTLVRQGQLAVYPSSQGQEACQIGSVLALRPTDWLFPTYRESVALITRGVDPVEVLSMLRGEWHCGYEPRRHFAAPQTTPLATQTIHAVGVAYAAQLRDEDTVALAYLGDGATSEGDFHEAINFAGVFKAPVIFFVQNNHYAISVPLAKQTAAPSLAHKGIGYGVRGERVDGNDVAAVISVISDAADRARAGGGPTLIEAHTYRMAAHTNADDATRYRIQEEVQTWQDKDPVDRLRTYLRTSGQLNEEKEAEFADRADAVTADVRTRFLAGLPPIPPSAAPPPQLRSQADQLRAELAAEGEE